MKNLSKIQKDGLLYVMFWTQESDGDNKRIDVALGYDHFLEEVKSTINDDEGNIKEVIVLCKENFFGGDKVSTEEIMELLIIVNKVFCSGGGCNNHVARTLSFLVQELFLKKENLAKINSFLI